MSLPQGSRTHGLPSHVRSSSGLPTSHHGASNSTTQASLLQTRIQEKRAELESLRQLRDLSAGLAGQMEQLERKLATLSDGTEAVAAVLSNWHTVLRAVYMASAKIPKPTSDETDPDGTTPLPQTLVRIPIEQAEAAQRDQEAALAAAAGTIASQNTTAGE